MADDPLLTKDETAKWLSVSTVTVKRMVYDGRLPVVKVGKLLRFRRSDIERYLGAEGAHAPVASRIDDQELQPLLDAVAELIASAWRAKQAAALKVATRELKRKLAGGVEAVT